MMSDIANQSLECSLASVCVNFGRIYFPSVPNCRHLARFWTRARVRVFFTVLEKKRIFFWCYKKYKCLGESHISYIFLSEIKNERKNIQNRILAPESKSALSKCFIFYRVLLCLSFKFILISNPLMTKIFIYNCRIIALTWYSSEY